MTPRNKSALILCLVGLIASACLFAADAPKTESLQFPAGKETVGGFIAEPNSTARHPAVIVLPSWWGLNDWVKEQTQKLGEQGFVALAVDLYGGGRVATNSNTALDLR